MDSFIQLTNKRLIICFNQVVETYKPFKKNIINMKLKQFPSIRESKGKNNADCNELEKKYHENQNHGLDKILLPPVMLYIY